MRRLAARVSACLLPALATYAGLPRPQPCAVFPPLCSRVQLVIRWCVEVVSLGLLGLHLIALLPLPGTGVALQFPRGVPEGQAVGAAGSGPGPAEPVSGAGHWGAGGAAAAIAVLSRWPASLLPRLPHLPLPHPSSGPHRHPLVVECMGLPCWAQPGEWRKDDGAEEVKRGVGTGL